MKNNNKKKTIIPLYRVFQTHVYALFLEDCITYFHIWKPYFWSSFLILRGQSGDCAELVQTLIVNLQSFTDPSVWRAIFFLRSKRATNFWNTLSYIWTEQAEIGCTNQEELGQVNLRQRYTKTNLQRVFVDIQSTKQQSKIILLKRNTNYLRHSFK